MLAGRGDLAPTGTVPAPCFGLDAGRAKRPRPYRRSSRALFRIACWQGEATSPLRARFPRPTPTRLLHPA
ncbi:MAG: hypothetical protein N2651_08350 [Fimbriimonadales bacterium]|nr:hypothetical protein [Fimbriimonadales bacterium]